MASRKLASILTAILVCLSACAPVAADNTATGIIGTVVDVRGGAVARAKITAINDARGLQRETVTNDEGYFEILFLPAGVYTLTAEMSGFATIRVTQLEAQSRVNRRLLIVLQPRGRAETITVKASSVTVEANDATLKYSITREQTETFPIISTSEGRAILESLPLTVPGVTPLLFPGRLGEGLSINGARPIANVFTLNGGDHNDTESSLAASAFPNPEALQEVTIVTNNYKADLGGGAGGIINVVTRSGGNAVHGGVRYLFNHEAFNARNFFDKFKPRDRLNMFGGQFEGPVYFPGLYNGRDRTHFFFDLEARRAAGESGVRAVTFRDIPRTLPAKERSGDFSDYPLPHRPIDPLTGQPFPGGIIPGDRIDPIARYYLDHFIPMPDREDGLLDFLNQSDTAYTQATLRVDHRFNNSDLLSATYFLNNVGASSPLQLPEGERKNTGKEQSFVLNYTHVFSSRMANQMTATLNRSAQFLRIIKPGFSDVHPREAGFTGINIQDEKLLGLPAIFMSGLQYRKVGDEVSIRPIGTNIGYGTFPEEGFKTTLTVRDDLTINHGLHTFGTGGGARYFLFDKYVSSINGSFVFGENSFQETGSSVTGNGIADFLLGLPARYRQSTGSIQHQRDKSLFIYAMDDWKARPNLTINIGLRYEIDAPTTDNRDGVIVFRPGARSTIHPESPVGVLFPDDPDPILGRVPSGAYRTDYNNIAPRIGLAFAPEAENGWLGRVLGKTTIRAGIGMFYASTYGLSFSFFSPTFVTNIEQFIRGTGTFANPFGSAPNPFPVSPGDFSSRRDTDLHTFDPAFETAYTYQYNLTIQRELPGQIMVEMAYVGNNSFHTDREIELNFYSAQKRRFPQFFDIGVQESTGRARYDSFQLRVSRRMSSGLLLDGSYVYAKGLDNSSGPLSLDEGSFYDQPNDTSPHHWARSAFDRRHNFVISYVYDLPLSKERGLLGLIAGGWRIGGLTQIRSGPPMDLFSGDFLISNSKTLDIVGPYHRLDPKKEQTFTISGQAITGHFFFDPRAFRDPPSRRRGSLGRNVFDGPAVNETSISLAKRTPLIRAHEIEIRADILNLFNQVNFHPPERELYERFGQVFDALPARRIQLSVRYRF